MDQILWENFISQGRDTENNVSTILQPLLSQCKLIVKKSIFGPCALRNIHGNHMDCELCQTGFQSLPLILGTLSTWNYYLFVCILN